MECLFQMVRDATCELAHYFVLTPADVNISFKCPVLCYYVQLCDWLCKGVLVPALL